MINLFRTNLGPASFCYDIYGVGCNNKHCETAHQGKNFYISASTIWNNSVGNLEKGEVKVSIGNDQIYKF